MDEQSFAALGSECSETLRPFMIEAEKTCAMLSTCKGEPLSLVKLQKIMSQRSRENEAHQLYMEVRGRLFEAAKHGYGQAVWVVG